MAADSSGLVRAAIELRASSPAMWTGFLGALEEYARAMQAEMMKCQPEMLPKAQGMALMVHEILGILVDAPKTYDRMQQVQREKAHGRRANTPGF